MHREAAGEDRRIRRGLGPENQREFELSVDDLAGAGHDLEDGVREAADLLDAAEGVKPDNTLQPGTHINENYTGRGTGVCKSNEIGVLILCLIGEFSLVICFLFASFTRLFTNNETSGWENRKNSKERCCIIYATPCSVHVQVLHVFEDKEDMLRELSEREYDQSRRKVEP